MTFITNIVSWILDFVMEKTEPVPTVHPEQDLIEFGPPELRKLSLPELPAFDNQCRPAHVYPCPPVKSAPPDNQQPPPEPPVMSKPFRPPCLDIFPPRDQQSPAIHKDSPLLMDMPYVELDPAPSIHFENQRHYCGPPPAGFIPPEPFSPPNSYVSPRNELEEMKEHMEHLDTVLRLLMEERAALTQNISKLEEKSVAMPVSPPNKHRGFPVHIDTPFGNMRYEDPPQRIDWRFPLQTVVPEEITWRNPANSGMNYANVPPMMDLETGLTFVSEWEEICLD